MKQVYEILSRYVIALAIMAISLIFPIFYIIFKPLTVFPVIFILKLFYNVSVLNSGSIAINNVGIELISSCIASSAYMLLFILNLITKGISLKKRFFIFLFDAALLLIMNILRILILVVMAVNNFSIFDVTHKLFWYGISTFYVFLIWVLSVYVFKIRSIPFVSDILFLSNSGKKS